MVYTPTLYHCNIYTNIRIEVWTERARKQNEQMSTREYKAHTFRLKMCIFSFLAWQRRNILLFYVYTHTQTQRENTHLHLYAWFDFCRAVKMHFLITFTVLWMVICYCCSLLFKFCCTYYYCYYCSLNCCCCYCSSLCYTTFVHYFVELYPIFACWFIYSYILGVSVFLGQIHAHTFLHLANGILIYYLNNLKRGKRNK